jgi:D-arabinose 1-dehydrogenase-like Zn-dependent alcohol dehydrogenase
MNSMNAIIVREFGSPEVLRLEQVEMPAPRPGEVLVHVQAVAVLRTRDAAARSGNHPFSRQISLPHIFGSEHVGVVTALGSGVSEELRGKRVAVSGVIVCGRCRPCRTGHDEVCDAFEMIGIHRPGSYAEYVTVPAASLYDIPDAIAAPVGASMAAVGPVAHAQLEAAQLDRGQWVLVPGAAGALGSMLVAQALWRGLRVIAVERSGINAVPLQELGVDAVLDGGSDLLAPQVESLTAGEGVSAVVDNLALPELFNNYFPALAPLATVVISGSVAAAPLALDARSLYLNGQRVVGVRTGNHRQIYEFWQDVAAGFTIPDELVHTFPLERAGEAHASLEENAKPGNYALTVG